MPPGDLDRALCGMVFPTNEDVLVGLDRPDDAAVYRVSDTLALVQTVDFFTPIVDDPFRFGQIAAANALSDIYAMGGEPKTAMNLVAFPIKEMALSVLRKILEGGMDKLKEAGVALVGGHSIADTELKYGLSVTGFVDPRKVWIKKSLHRGDRLILTKPLGTGILNTALKAGLLSRPLEEKISLLMSKLNKSAAEVLRGYPVRACTDVTGFGLLGHLAEMVVGASAGVRISADRVPVLSESKDYAEMGMIPAGAYNNKSFRESMIEIAGSVPQWIQDVLYDPQTSGGLLVCLPEQTAERAVADLIKNGAPETAIIGEVTEEPKGKIVVE